MQKSGGTAFPVCSGSPWGQERTSLTTVSPRFYGICGTKNHYPEHQRSLLAAWMVGNDGPRLSSGKKGCGHLKNVSISVTPAGGPQAAKGASAHSRELRLADPPCPTPRGRARRPLTRPAPARGHAPVPVLLWRPAPPRVCVVGGRPSLTRTRLAGAREPAVRGVSWAGRRADVAPGCGQVPQPSSPPPPLLPPGFV